ncbi:MAG: hypothetical protein KDA42_04565 [Planctomycetales bacterium]|nr:hypothetical protein [Planctomycetales bacterium]
MSEPFDPEIDSAEEWEEVEEEIGAEEVENVVAKLEELMETIESETIYEYLQAAVEGISSLVEWEEEEETTGEGPTSEAA